LLRVLILTYKYNWTTGYYTAETEAARPGTTIAQKKKMIVIWNNQDGEMYITVGRTQDCQPFKNYKMRKKVKVSSNSMQLPTLQEEEQTAMH
jgi:hypothetical protein